MGTFRPNFAGDGLFVFFINVDAGNLIILRKKDHAFIIDAGGQLDGPTQCSIWSILYGAKVRSVFLTDARRDHYNLLDTHLGAFIRDADGSNLVSTIYLIGTRSEWARSARERDGYFLELLNDKNVIFTGKSGFFASGESEKTIEN